MKIAEIMTRTVVTLPPGTKPRDGAGVCLTKNKIHLSGGEKNPPGNPNTPAASASGGGGASRRG